VAAIYLAGIDGHVTWGFTGIALATAACLYGSAQAPALGRGLSALTKPLRWVGRRSYEIYLLHIIVLGALLDVLPRSGITPALRLPWMALFVALSCVAASGMSRWIAEPANDALRRGWLARRRVAPGLAASTQKRHSLPSPRRFAARRDTNALNPASQPQSVGGGLRGRSRPQPVVCHVTASRTFAHQLSRRAAGSA
jgi:peptidoglycan/LPS O-acetylase OafA/YrhL